MKNKPPHRVRDMRFANPDNEVTARPVRIKKMAGVWDQELDKYEKIRLRYKRKPQYETMICQLCGETEYYKILGTKRNYCTKCKDRYNGNPAQAYRRIQQQCKN